METHFHLRLVPNASAAVDHGRMAAANTSCTDVALAELAAKFETYRQQLHSVAARLLGSRSDADDAVQEAWLRLSRAEAGEIDNFPGWLTTVVRRICLDMLRRERTRRDDPMGVQLPDGSVDDDDMTAAPDEQAMLSAAVGTAMQLVLDVLSPTERVAFVLHDAFTVPFEQIGQIIGRTRIAARQLASRARRKIRAAEPRADSHAQLPVVDALRAAARSADIDALVSILHEPELYATWNGRGTRIAS